MTTTTKAKKTLDKFRSRHLDAKEAVVVAKKYFQELFPEAAKAGMRLEEIEESKDGKCWLVTLGYDTTAPRRLAFEVGMVRAYTLLTVDRAAGKVLSAKIRSVE